KWSPVDSLVWLKAMAYDLRGNFADELARARLTASLGPELVADLYPAYPADQHRSILSAGDWPTSSRANSGMPPALTAEPLLAPVTPSVPVVDLADPGVDAAMTAAAGALGALTALLGHGEGGGSNSWVIGPQKSATGKPLLANDPHLGVAIPSIWSQVGLQCRTVGPECPFAVAGFSLAGVPGVVIGHNDSLAWGFTNLGPDVTDFYLEKVTDAAYLRDGAMVPLEVRVETLKVRGGEDVSLTARRTVHGPIVSDVMSGPAAVGQRAVLDGIVQPDSYAVSLAWTGLVPSTSADALFAINLARDPAALRSAAKGFAVPSQNIVFADTVGNIGYQAPGLIPVRRAPSPSQPAGYLPVPGWDSQLDWQGWVAFEDLPWALNPRDGFIVAANQQVSATTPPFLTTEWDAGWRSQRIREQITAAAPGTLTVEMMSAIQSDDTDGFAATLVPALLAIDLSGDPFTQSAQDLLRAWDHTTPTGSSLDQQERSASSAAAYFYTVWVTLLDGAFNDQVPAELRADGGSRWRLVVSRLLDQPTSNWWDDKRTASIVEGRDEILRHALVEARLALTKSLGADVSSWSWGRLHTLTLRHPVLGGASLPGPIQALVNRGPVPLPGSSAVVNANGWNATEGYAVNWAPSMRMVVDLGDLDASRWV
ncbi:MAG: penicillin acylase family protein, partial [Candidatus Phosphoribacter sp.]